MSEYLNSKYIHIATEVLYGCMLTYFVYSRNKQLSQRIQLLESKLVQYEQLLQEHDHILQTLLQNKGEVVPSKQPPQKKKLLEQKLNQSSIPSTTPTLILSPTAHTQPKPQTFSSPPVPVETPYFYEETTVEEVDEEDVDVIETQGGYEENLDEEIHKELNRLKLLKQEGEEQKTN